MLLLSPTSFHDVELYFVQQHCIFFFGLNSTHIYTLAYFLAFTVRNLCIKIRDFRCFLSFLFFIEDILFLFFFALRM